VNVYVWMMMLYLNFSRITITYNAAYGHVIMKYCITEHVLNVKKCDALPIKDCNSVEK
jgi:hypothetical protein